MGVFYKCSCGFATTDADKKTALRSFLDHNREGFRLDGKGVHQSLGTFDAETGELIRKPYKELTDEEKKARFVQLQNQQVTKRKNKSASKNGSNPDTDPPLTTPGGKPPAPEKEKEKKTPVSTSKTTTDASVATSVILRPRAIEIDYDPIIRAGQIAAKDLWGWDVPLDVFLRRVVLTVFADRDIDLAKPYVIRQREEVPDAG